MLFNSLIFPVFLVIVLTIYWYLRKTDYRNLLLLIASYIFYGWWDVRFLLLIWLTSMIDYWCGVSMSKSTTKLNRKFYLWISLFANLGTLALFKYFNFFSENFIRLTQSLGWKIDFPVLNVILPVGISFYTFQELSYVIDVYWKRIPACKNPLIFFLYVSFFPQLVAGPIERAGHLIPQLEKDKHFPEKKVSEALRYILWGFFLKCVVADNLAPIVNYAYQNFDVVSGWELLFGTYAFAFQIYGDFAGYSYIAIGTAMLFGVQLCQNFNAPYFSETVKEFWTRWHMSLVSFFRDYVYIGFLKGNRVSEVRHRMNVLATFALSGLWHGANWTFIVWGVMNGMFYFLAKPFKTGNFYSETLNRIVTFHLICLGWLYFRSESVSQGNYILGKILNSIGSARIVLDVVPWPMILSIGSVLLIEWVQQRRKVVVDLEPLPSVARFAIYSGLILIFFFAGSFQRIPFIYFQF